MVYGLGLVGGLLLSEVGNLNLVIVNFVNLILGFVVVIEVLY